MSPKDGGMLVETITIKTTEGHVTIRPATPPDLLAVVRALCPGSPLARGADSQTAAKP